MPKKKTPTTFDEHVGAIVGGLAAPHGGRPFLVTLMDWSKNTVDRRIIGTHGFIVKELYVIAPSLNTTVDAITRQALTNYGGGDPDVGVQRLIREEGAVSDAPDSFDNITHLGTLKKVPEGIAASKDPESPDN